MGAVRDLAVWLFEAIGEYGWDLLEPFLSAGGTGESRPSGQR